MNQLKLNCKHSMARYLTDQQQATICTLIERRQILTVICIHLAFPEDDRLEYAVIEATKRHEQAQARINAESRAAELLAKATKAMSFSHQNAREALTYSTYGMG